MFLVLIFSSFKAFVFLYGHVLIKKFSVANLIANIAKMGKKNDPNIGKIAKNVQKIEKHGLKLAKK